MDKIKIICKPTKDLCGQVDTSGLEDLIADLLIQNWIKEQNKMKEDKIECHPEASKQVT